MFWNKYRGTVSEGGAREPPRWIGIPPGQNDGCLPNYRSTQVYAQRLLLESLLMLADLSNEEGKLICSQLTVALSESKRTQTVGMDPPCLSYFFLVASTHELA
jgi:hypothetical protein